MIGYLIKSSLCLIVLLMVYRAFLEQEKMHRFNRYFLIFGLMFSLTIPLLTIELPAPAISSAQLSSQIDLLSSAQTYQTPIGPAPTGNEIVPQEQTDVSIIPYLFIGYLLISGVLFLRLLQNLYSLAVKVYCNERVPFQNAALVLVPDGKVPHSFFNYIFVNKQMYRDGTIDEAIYTHELTHVRQKHSLDILFIELLKVAFWFNPAIYFYKKAIQLNHEFLADQTVVSDTQNVSAYQRLLLKIQTNEKDIQLTSSIQYSITKKRIMMMTKQSTTLQTAYKQLAIIPLLAALIFTFSTRTAASQDVSSMSLQELMEVVNKKMESADSLSAEEQEKLQSFLIKIRMRLTNQIKAPTTPVQTTPLKTTQIPTNSLSPQQSLKILSSAYNDQVEYYYNIAPVEENRDKLDASYKNLMALYNTIDKFRKKINNNPPPPPPKPLSPAKRIKKKSKIGKKPPQPPVKIKASSIDTTTLNMIGNEYSSFIDTYLEIQPIRKTKQKWIKYINH